jgi:hypothetical protein
VGFLVEAGVDIQRAAKPADGEWSNPRRRLSRLEWIVGALAATVLATVVAIEPEVLEAPFQSGRSLAFTVGGTLLAAIALLVMVRQGVSPVVRVLVIGAPFVVVSWLLISPYFVDDEVDDGFETSIAAAGKAPPSPAPTDPATDTTAGEPGPTTTAPPAGPRLLGSGRFVGLAGHDGSGDAGLFGLDDRSFVLRLENFDIENGPDLRLYLVQGAAQTAPAADSLDLGKLRGNVGDQTYELPEDFSPIPGDWTVLVWCDAFSVEFVAATVSVSA